MTRWSTVVAALVLVVAACGGDSDGGTTAAAPGGAGETTQAAGGGGGGDATTQAPSDAGDGGGSGSGDSGSEGSGPSTATVTIGDETYNFSTEGAVVAQCLSDLFGVFSVQLPLIDDSGAVGDGSVQILILREGTDPDVVGQVNAVNVSVGDANWVADEADMMFEQSDLLQPGMSQVDSAEVDGLTVRGTATFYNSNTLFSDEIETATGSFEATCGEERTS